ncbi:MAG TPA: potassium-transporting ATPase subunit F [Polyangiales bacterium]
MTTLMWLGGGLSVLVLVYLMFALLYPEKLS